MWAENWGLCPCGGEGAGSPSNTMWSGPSPTSVPSFILIRPTVWPQYTSVTDRTDRTDRQRTDSIGRTVLQTVAQKFSKLYSKRIHRLTDRRVVCKFREIWRTEVAEIVRCLPDKKAKFRLALPFLLLRGSRPKSAGTSHRQCTQSAPDFIQIGSLSAELIVPERVNTVKTLPKVFPIFG